MWKVFEHETAAGPGIVSFISASSYLDGDAFCGMREHMRHLCDEIWIIDLGGEGRGTRKSENVFAIQTPVAIAIAARFGRVRGKSPARVKFIRIDGAREDKLKRLDSIQNFAGLQWEECPDEWQAPFRPAGTGKYFDWPLLTDLLPWQHSGAQFKRTWPICPDPETLKDRWRALLYSNNKAEAFKETRDRKISHAYPPLLPSSKHEKPIDQLPRNAPPPDIKQYAYRSFDRQWILADSRLGDFLRPNLWSTQGKRQVYLTTAFTQALSTGPALTVSAKVPDLHHFSGRGAKDIVPLYRDAQGEKANILPGLLDLLKKVYGRKVPPEDFVACIYGMIGHPDFTNRFSRELGNREIRVPLTKDAALFAKVHDIGARLLWLHTYGKRFIPKGLQAGHLPKGKARCIKPVPGDAGNYPENFENDGSKEMLRVGEGEFAPVSPEIYEFEISGLKVVQSWLKYRMRGGGGRSPRP